MNKAQALAVLVELYGKKAMWRVAKDAPNATMRGVFKDTLPAMKQSADQAAAAAENRRRELLADPEYIRLHNAATVAANMVNEAHSMLGHYRYTVGHDNGIAFVVRGQGDTWQQAIDAAKAVHTGSLRL